MENKEEKVKEKEEINEEVKDSKAKKVLSKVKKHGKKIAVAAGAGVLLAVGYIAGKAKSDNSEADSLDLEILELLPEDENSES